MAVPYQERMIVADITALKNLTISSVPAIADTIFIGVSDIGDGTPAFYQYKAAATDPESLPNIVEPTAPTAGRWVQFGGRQNTTITYSTSDPTLNPPTTTTGTLPIHIQNNGDASNVFVKFWIGIDSTGALGQNGWVGIQLI